MKRFLMVVWAASLLLGAAPRTSPAFNFEQTLRKFRTGFLKDAKEYRIRRVDYLKPHEDPFLKKLNASQRVIYQRYAPAVVRIGDEGAFGSGFFITPEGRILTNGHVVGFDAVGKEVKVQTSMGPRTATVLAIAPGRDVAILQVQDDFKDWPALTLGKDSEMAEGDIVFALGNPLNMGISLSMGTLSKTRQPKVNAWSDMVQSDIEINNGNSGGPLLNYRGEVIGMNTSVVRSQTGGLSMAVRAQTLREAVKEFADTNGLVDGFVNLGVEGNSMMIARTPEGLAGQAGLKKGDSIVTFPNSDGESSGKRNRFYRQFGSRKPGETITLGISRGVAVQVHTRAVDASTDTAAASAAAVFSPHTGFVLVDASDLYSWWAAVTEHSVEEVEIGGKRYSLTVVNVAQQRTPFGPVARAVVMRVDPKSGWEASQDPLEQVQLPVQKYEPAAAGSTPGAG